jgi:hypothetical protein
VGVVGRVSWDRYDGEDVEATVAMMINREHPNSIRITPSQGDGGVDILDRNALPDGDVIYQVKRYAGPLTPSQKKKVENSLARLLSPQTRDPRWSDLTVAQWRLVTPWNPSPEAEHWLQELGETYAVNVAWDGLTTVDQLAAKHPDVIDYYLHDGKSAITEAYRDAMALMSLGNVDDTHLEVPQVTERVQQALNTLDRDPHYLYEFHFGQGEPPDPSPRPGLVIGTYIIDTARSRWWQVDVIARCAASVEERPITVTGALTVDNDTEFAADVREFYEFGTPFTSPEGAYNGHLDAPGGLGGELANATIRTSPAANHDLGDNANLALEIIDPDDNVLAEVTVSRTDRSQGSKGVRAVLTETNGVFEFVHRFNLVEQTSAQRLALLNVVDSPVTAVLAGVEFLANYHDPNQMRARVRELPASRAKTYSIPTVPDDATTGNLDQLRRLLLLLIELQEHTDTVLTLPDLTKFMPQQYRDWQFAAAILRGDDVTMTVKEGIGFHVEVPADTSPPEGTFSVDAPLDIAIGEQVVNFGTVRATLTDPNLLRIDPVPEELVRWVFTTPDRTISYSRPGIDEAAADAVNEQPSAAAHAGSSTRTRGAD